MGPYIAGDTIDVYGDQLLAGSYRSHDPLEIYDLRNGEVIKSVKWQHEEENKGGMVMSCQFGNPASETIIAGSSNLHELKLFDRKEDEVLSSVTDFSGPVIALHMDHKGKRVAVGTKTGGVVMLKYKTGQDDDDGED